MSRDCRRIEELGAPVANPYARLAPETFGPIPPAWHPRLPKGGTYDQHWVDHVWPNWAEDYDFVYHNSSHPDLICPRHLVPGDRVTLDNLIEGYEHLTLIMPALQPIAGLVRDDGSASQRGMTLDTLFLDIAARARDAHVYLSWRVTFEPAMFKAAVLIERSDLAEFTAEMAGGTDE